jgi:hypothetical protein
MGDEEFWVATHEAWPGDPTYIRGLDGFGEPGLMFEAMERDALMERQADLAMERAALALTEDEFTVNLDDLVEASEVSDSGNVKYYEYCGQQFRVDLDGAEAIRLEKEEDLHGLALELTLLTKEIEERTRQIEQENAAKTSKPEKPKNPDSQKEPSAKQSIKISPTKPKLPIKPQAATAPLVQENVLWQLFKFILKFFGIICLIIAILWFLVAAISSCSAYSKTTTEPATTKPSATNSDYSRTTTTPNTSYRSNDLDNYNAWLEDNAIEDGEYDFDVEGGDWESVDPPDRNPASGYKPEWDKYYKEDFPEVDF